MAWPFDLVPPQSGPQIGLPPQQPRRPVVLYRTEPGTREFGRPEGMAPATTGGSLQDRIAQVLQRAQLMEDQGGTPDNSPQLRSLVVQHDALQQALNQQIQAQAEQSKANALNAEVQWKGDPKTFANQVLLRQIESGQAAPSQVAAAMGQPPDPKAMAAEKGYGKVPFREAIAGMTGPLPQGGPDYQALASAYPELPARVAGQPYHWYEQQYPNPLGQYLGGPAKLPLQDLLLSSGTGLTERIRSGLLGRVLPHQAEALEAQALFGQPAPGVAPAPAPLPAAGPALAPRGPVQGGPMPGYAPLPNYESGGSIPTIMNKVGKKIGVSSQNMERPRVGAKKKDIFDSVQRGRAIV